MSVRPNLDKKVHQIGNAISIKFKAEPELETYDDVQIVCKEILKFAFELPANKEDWPYLYLSDNA